MCLGRFWCQKRLPLSCCRRSGSDIGVCEVYGEAWQLPRVAGMIHCSWFNGLSYTSVQSKSQSNYTIHRLYCYSSYYAAPSIATTTITHNKIYNIPDIKALHQFKQLATLHPGFYPFLFVFSRLLPRRSNPTFAPCGARRKLYASIFNTWFFWGWGPLLQMLRRWKRSKTYSPSQPEVWVMFTCSM
jgi:hypothetical protein